MSDVSNEKFDKAVQEYLEAIDELKELRDKYFPVRRVIPGEPIVLGELVTEEALAGIRKAEIKVDEKWKKIETLVSRRFSSNAKR